MAADGSEVVDLRPEDEKDAQKLFDACQRDDTESVRELLDEGANIEAKTSWGATPLLVACFYGSCNCIELLLEKGADLTFTVRGNTPLHYLCTRENTSDIVLQLLARGVPIEDYNNDGDTPLIIACRVNNVRCASVLLNNGASVDKPCLTTGRMVLEILRKGGSPECVKLLMDQKPFHSSHHDYDDTEEEKRQRKRVKELQYQKDLEEIPLFVACIEGDVERTRELLEAGADPDVCKSDLFSALQMACCLKKAECVQLLLEHGATVDITTPYGYGHTPLFDACGFSHDLKCTRLLLERGADVNAVNQFGETPLFWGSRAGQLEYVRLLLEHDGNPFIRNNKDETPLDVARAKGRDEVVRLLEMCSESHS